MRRVTLLWIPTLLALSGCAALPLTAATAPLAVAGWGAMFGSVFDDWAQPLPPLVLHAEAGPMLDRAGLDSGVVDPEANRVADAGPWLRAWGLERADVEAGRVQMVRIGHHEGADPAQRRAIVLPVRLAPAPALQPAPRGMVIELRVTASGPVTPYAVRSDRSAAADCRYTAPPARAAKDEWLRGRKFGHERLTDTLVCAALQTAGWQRAASFWHWVPDWDYAAARPSGSAPHLAPELAALAPRPETGPQTGQPANAIPTPAFPHDRAVVMVYRNRSTQPNDQRIAMRVDGQALMQLRSARCAILLLTPGEHVLAVGKGAPGAWTSEPLMELALRLGPGDRAYVEHVTNEHEASNLLRSARDHKAFWEAAVQLVERPVLTAVDGCRGSTPVITP